MADTLITKAPPWFDHYIKASSSDHLVTICGCKIHYRKWQKDSKIDRPSLFFVHGNGAHLHWWDFIAPRFLDNYDVIAVDLSGSGDSEHRREYSLEVFCNEIIGVCEDAKLNTITIIGHSFGGNIARSCAFLYPNFFSRLILVDSSLENRAGRPAYLKTKNTSKRYYDTLEEATKRFKLRPSQPCANQYILDYIGTHSVRKTTNGYYFKLDEQLFKKMNKTNLPTAFSMIKAISCPVGLIYGAKSRFFTPQSIQRLERVLPKKHIISIKNTYHHLFLEAPEIFVEKLDYLANLMLPKDPLMYSP